MDKIGVGSLKNGDDKSEKLRLLIDKLYDYHVRRNPVGVTTQQPQKPKNQRYCKDFTAWVSIKEVCEKCRLGSPQKWLNCPEVLKEQGIQ